MLTIYTMAFNEETILPFMLSHYKTNFPTAKIVLRDNCSTDKTVEIAKDYGCQVIPYDTNGIHDDFELRQLKNNCWKNAETDWVCCLDPDEILRITEEELTEEERQGTTIITTQGYDMVNLDDNYDLDSMKYGIKDKQYSKKALFNRKYIQEINYECGGHISNPIGNVKYSNNVYKLCHYNWICEDYLIKRYALTASRMSENNKRFGMGSYNFQKEEETKQSFNNRREQCKREGVKVL